MRLVPPGGFAGFAQMTPASQDALTKRGMGSTGKRTRRKAKKKTSGTRRKKRKNGKRKSGSKKAAKSYGPKLKKGSPAAKSRMAKLRKMRGKGKRKPSILDDDE